MDTSDQDYQILVNEFNSKNDIALLGCRLDQLFETVVEAFPCKTALIHNNTKSSFKELNSWANVLARDIFKQGLGHGDVFGLAVSRSTDLIVVMLAILKLGAVYVPIDPSFPAKRIDQMIEDADCKLIFVSDGCSLNSGLARWKDLCFGVGETRRSSSSDTTNLRKEISPQDLAYIIYTSGSTGRPKGVEISHGAAANFLSSLQKYEPGCNEHDRLLAITTISFDMSSLELLLPLISGATMILANEGAVKDPRELISLMREHQATILQATPATWTMLLESGWNGSPRLSKIICGGEPLSRKLADRLLACADSVWNVYGPSETTYGSVGRVDESDIVVGNPIINGRIYVLDKTLSPVPMGCEGEVYIGGGSVSNGYRNKPELNNSVFLDNPFHGGRFFRTGDLARFIGPKKLQVIGRADGVVKIRGHRIEVGDVEAVLVEHPDVSEAVAISRDDRLIAYCVMHAPCQNAASIATTLRPWITERLPPYMVPSFFVPMATLPLSPNQKVNRNALPSPMEVLHSQSALQPRSELERDIKSIWQKILGHDHIGTRDNFFSIGGDSVRVIRMQSLLEDLLNRPVPTPKLFEHHTIEKLAAYLNGASDGTHRLESTLRAHSEFSSSHEDIAIVSMACRLPGNVSTPEELWWVLQSGKDTTINVPKSRWDAGKLYNPDPDIKGKSYSSKGGFLDSIHSYDASFFGISPREAQAMDVVQHIMMELSWEGFERAGYTKESLSESATGVFLGVSNNGASTAVPAELEGYSITGSASATLSGRISYVLNLQGPSMTLDTACSSSLVATHLACNALRQGECNMALAGGISLLLTPSIHIEFSRLRGLSPDGWCRAFSDDADGTGFSEGAAVVLLKRLSDAERDGDEIHAVLRGTTVMHGGYSAGLTVPNGPGQETLIRTCLARSALEPNDIDYIEAHGTATTLGDPIEATALAGVFGPNRHPSKPLWLGSVKSNIGHTQAAAGLAGMLKVVLSLRNNVIPRTLHVSEPSRGVDWKNNNMELVLTDRLWLPHGDRLRRAGVSAFGIGGTNAHVVIEEPPRPVTERVEKSPKPMLPADFIFVLSAKGESALRCQAKRLRSHLERIVANAEILINTAYSLARSRTLFPWRVMVTAKNKPQVLEELDAVSSDISRLFNANDASTPTLAMLFSGQGTQRLGTGQSLYAVYPIFRDALDDVAAKFAELQFPLFDIMWPKSRNRSSKRTEFTQPALFSLQVSLFRLWQSWGVKPSFLLGHSVGEIAVAHVSGILGLSDACRLVMARSRLMQAVSRTGSMWSIAASAQEIRDAIQALSVSDRVEISCFNTPYQTVISGDVDAVEIVATQFKSMGRRTKTLDTSHAFHSFHMDGILEDFRTIAQTVLFSPPNIPVVSSMTGRLAENGELERAEYWVQQMRHSVRFSEAFQNLTMASANIFLELGPSSTLCGLGAACFADVSLAENMLWLPSLNPDKNESSVIQHSLGRLHVRGIPVDWAAYYKPFGCQRITLPTYPFQRGDFHPTANHDGNQNEVEAMMFDVNWRQFDTEKLPSSTGTWGVLPPASGTAWTREIELALSSTHVRLVPVKSLQEAEHLDGVLALWDAGDTEHVAQVAHSFTAKGLAQLQEAIRCSFTLPLVWVTCLAVGTDHDDSSLRIGAGPLWGLMRTARSEHPGLCLRLIDLDSNLECLAEKLVSALALDDEKAEVAIRNGKLMMPHLEYAHTDPLLLNANAKPLLRTDGVVLVTGGLGNLGSLIVRKYVQSYGIRDLVLMSRRGIEAPGADILMAELARLGAKVTIVRGDIAQLECLETIMKAFTADRPLRGVIHAAGAVDSGVLSRLTPQKCATTFAPKVDGLWNLHQLTKKNTDVDLFVMLSSISSVIGLPGLGNYAAANSFMDALAYMRRTYGLPATSIAYGVWSGGGMLDILAPTTCAHLSQLGLGFLSPEAGLEMLERAVHQSRALTVAAALDVKRLKSYFDKQGRAPFSLRSILNHVDVSNPNDAATTNIRDTLIRVAPEQHDETMLRVVQMTIAKVLGYTVKYHVDPSVPLTELGIDSLTGLLIRNQLAMIIGMPLPPNIALLHRNLKSLSSFLLTKLREESSVSSSPGASDSVTMSSSLASSVTSRIDLSAIRQGILDSSIQFKNLSECQDTHVKHPKTVLITGSTGFVGAFMVHEFLRRSVDVYCLVRAHNHDNAQERMIATLREYGLWKTAYEPLLKSIDGDLSKPLLGLSDISFADLANYIDTIVHSGALVDWMRPLDDYVGPNIFGTHEVLRLASCGRAKAVHFISTISTLPIHLGYGLTLHDAEYGYGTSKYLAERMVVAARFRGARASSYRLPFVSASTSNGQFRLDRGDFFNNLVSGSLELGAFPSIDADLSAVLPVDYLCSTIATIIADNQQDSIGKDYDFLNPQAPTFDHFFKTIGALAGCKKLLSFTEWHRRALEYAVAYPESSLARITPILDGYTDQTAGEMMKSLPVEQRVVELEAALAGTKAASSDSPLDHVSEILPLTSDVVPHSGLARAAESLRVGGDARVSFPESTSLFQLPGSIRTRHTDQDQADQEMAVKKQSLMNNAWRERAFEKLADTPEPYRSLIDSHFCWIQPLFNFIYRPAFTRDMKTGGPYFSQALLNAVLSHSVRWCRGEPGMEQLLAPFDGGAAFSKWAVEDVFKDIQHGNSKIPTVQALLLLSAQECGCGNRTQAWLYSGMAFRLIDDIGICVDGKRYADAGSFSTEDIEVRNRLFWSCYFWDKLISLYFGRAPMIQNSEISPPRVLMDDTAEIEPWTPHGLPTANYRPRQAHSISCFIQMCSLAEILNQILIHLYNPFHELSPTNAYQCAISEGSRLRDWWRDLPEHLKINLAEMHSDCPPSHIVTLNCLYHTINILLNRAKLKLSRESGLASAMADRNPLIHCVSSATSIIALFDLYKHTFGEGHIILSLAYSVYTAASIFLLELKAIGHSAPNTLERLNFCIVINTALSNISKELGALGIQTESLEPAGSTVDATEPIANNSLLPLPMDIYHPPSSANDMSGSVAQNDEPILLDLSYLNGQIEGTGSYNLLDMSQETYGAFLQIEPLSVTMNPEFEIH
ncbi:SwnK [Curvularia clavata]|uniref:SwnK n=1 Tax=Curvularia clavata TaxID=95742 RepID=A0A9Q8Z667_CURCL|nr:SwnK [Curvularia clavata]